MRWRHRAFSSGLGLTHQGLFLWLVQQVAKATFLGLDMAFAVLQWPAQHIMLVAEFLMGGAAYYNEQSRVHIMWTWPILLLGIIVKGVAFLLKLAAQLVVGICEIALFIAYCHALLFAMILDAPFSLMFKQPSNLVANFLVGASCFFYLYTSHLLPPIWAGAVVAGVLCVLSAACLVLYKPSTRIRWRYVVAAVLASACLFSAHCFMPFFHLGAVQPYAPAIVASAVFIMVVTLGLGVSAFRKALSHQKNRGKRGLYRRSKPRTVPKRSPRKGNRPPQSARDIRDARRLIARRRRRRRAAASLAGHHLPPSAGRSEAVSRAFVGVAPPADHASASPRLVADQPRAARFRGVRGGGASPADRGLWRPRPPASAHVTGHAGDGVPGTPAAPSGDPPLAKVHVAGAASDKRVLGPEDSGVTSPPPPSRVSPPAGSRCVSDGEASCGGGNTDPAPLNPEA